jgi:hypothetical protein
LASTRSRSSISWRSTATPGSWRCYERPADSAPAITPAVELLDLYNPDDGTVLSITLFEIEEDLRKGHATLSSMDPPRSGAVGRRVSVEMYEVPVKIDA